MATGGCTAAAASAAAVEVDQERLLRCHTDMRGAAKHAHGAGTSPSPSPSPGTRTGVSRSVGGRVIARCPVLVKPRDRHTTGPATSLRFVVGLQRILGKRRTQRGHEVSHQLLPRSRQRDTSCPGRHIVCAQRGRPIAGELLQPGGSFGCGNLCALVVCWARGGGRGPVGSRRKRGRCAHTAVWRSHWCPRSCILASR